MPIDFNINAQGQYEIFTYKTSKDYTFVTKTTGCNANMHHEKSINELQKPQINNLNQRGNRQ